MYWDNNLFIDCDCCGTHFQLQHSNTIEIQFCVFCGESLDERNIEASDGEYSEDDDAEDYYNDED